MRRELFGHQPPSEETLADLRRAAIAEATAPRVSRDAFKIRDIVRIGNGSRLIITKLNPNRPANCWSGVLENGTGKEYIFGPKHRPVKVGEAGEDHPALRAMAGRTAAKAGVSNEYRTIVNRLVEAVLNGDEGQARPLAMLVRELSQ